jgi:hypothetical protein
VSSNADPSKLPLEQQLPPMPQALPGDVAFDVNAPFWRPSGVDLFRHLGWRNVFFLPAAGLFALLIYGFFEPGLYWLFFSYLGIKFTTLAIAVPIALSGWAIGAAVKARKDPFCIHCGQCLLGLPATYICPECGRPYDLQMLDDYRRNPQWFIQRWRMRHNLPPRDAHVSVPATAPRRKSRDGT